jgi:hypothetical protein
MLPYLDLFGFSGLPDNWVPGVAPSGPGRATAIPPSDVAIVEGNRPGFVVQRIRVWSSEFNTRFRKRYGKTTPMGQSAPALEATGTTPPGITLAGHPVLGSMAFVLSIVAAGVLGAATFTWSSDGGLSQWSSVAQPALVAGGAGYTAPELAIARPAPGGVQATGTATQTAGVVTAVAIVEPGSGYSARFPATMSVTDPTGSGAVLGPTLTPVVFTTAAQVILPGSGVTATFTAAGTYASDNVYASETAVPEAVLGWLTACLTVDVYQGRGVSPQDPELVLAVADRDRIFALLKESADSENGLIDLPTSEDEDSAISTGGPFACSQQSPWEWTDIQERIGRRQDSRGGRG